MILKEERDERLKRVLNVGDLAKTVFAVHLLLLLLLLFLHSDIPVLHAGLCPGLLNGL